MLKPTAEALLRKLKTAIPSWTVRGLTAVPVPQQRHLSNDCAAHCVMMAAIILQNVRNQQPLSAADFSIIQPHTDAPACRRWILELLDPSIAYYEPEAPHRDGDASFDVADASDDGFSPVWISSADADDSASNAGSDDVLDVGSSTMSDESSSHGAGGISESDKDSNSDSEFPHSSASKTRPLHTKLSYVQQMLINTGLHIKKSKKKPTSTLKSIVKRIKMMLPGDISVETTPLHRPLPGRYLRILRDASDQAIKSVRADDWGGWKNWSGKNENESFPCPQNTDAIVQRAVFRHQVNLDFWRVIFTISYKNEMLPVAFVEYLGELHADELAPHGNSTSTIAPYRRASADSNAKVDAEVAHKSPRAAQRELASNEALAFDVPSLNQVRSDLNTPNTRFDEFL